MFIVILAGVAQHFRTGRGWFALSNPGRILWIKRSFTSPVAHTRTGFKGGARRPVYGVSDARRTCAMLVELQDRDGQSKATILSSKFLKVPFKSHRSLSGWYERRDKTAAALSQDVRKKFE